MEQTCRSQRGGRLWGLEEVSQRPYVHVCIAQGRRPQCGDGGGGGWVERDKVWGERRTSVIVSTTKN